MTCCVPLQMVLQSSRTLADLAEQTVIPADYLYTLIIFFMFMARLPAAQLTYCPSAPQFVISAVANQLLMRDAAEVWGSIPLANDVL